MDAFRTAVYRYAVYLAVLFIGGPLLLLLFVYGADIFVSYRGTASISEKNHAKRIYLKKSRNLPR
ncbi:hypothetical protein NPX90_25270 [Bacillus paranthracis]|uniref:hypothetical protein n=1 Tax=Bacillus paranthracis TaxID=2026186 RepID=UPI00062D8189|nr:hypothetical protein [Bacillus paranthracis]MCQ6524796.1 hypothetical protein [Bacillus paranthracis]